MASTDDLINVHPNLSRIFGPGSVFALDRAEHRNRRKLLAPPFHGQSIKNYEKIIEEETLRESANWPEGEEFRTLEPMNRITLNVILRTVFGADGVELDYLRRIIPPWAKLGSRMATLPGAAGPPRALRSVGSIGGIPPRLRPHRQHVDRQGRGGPAFRRAHRHPGVDAAQQIRRRQLDVASGHLRRVADVARRGTRDHRVDAGLGVRAATPSSRHRRQAGRGERRRGQRAAAGDDPGDTAGQDSDRLRRPSRRRGQVRTR